MTRPRRTRLSVSPSPHAAHPCPFELACDDRDTEHYHDDRGHVFPVSRAALLALAQQIALLLHPSPAPDPRADLPADHLPPRA